jgi:hypothetical protein
MKATTFSTTFSTLIGAGVVAVALGVVAQPANAFVITNTAASWDNATLSNGTVVGSDGVAASDANQVKFLDVNGQSQVRWGKAYYGGHYENKTETITKQVQVPKTRTIQVPVQVQVQKTKTVQVPVYDKRGKFTGYQTKTETYYVTETQMQSKTETYYVTENKTETVTTKVWVPPTYENQSGLGFKGVSNLDITTNKIFNLGALTHFNQTIYLDGRDAKKTDFSLDLNFGDAIGSKKFDFSFSVDETLNNTGNNNNGLACAYKTDAGKGCADKIAWDFAINENNIFETHDNKKYALKLVGFGSDLTGQSIVRDFISQEGGNNSANLFAKLVRVDRTQDIPEPASLLGLAGLGLYFARSRKNRSEELSA